MDQKIKAQAAELLFKRRGRGKIIFKLTVFAGRAFGADISDQPYRARPTGWTPSACKNKNFQKKISCFSPGPPTGPGGPLAPGGPG